MTPDAADAPRTVWVFHAGALGDFVLIWPLLRALHAQGIRTTVCAAASKAALAASCLGVESRNAEHPEITRLWAAEPLTGEPAPDHADVVISFLFGDQADAARSRWEANTRRWLDAREIIHAGPPGSASRENVWRRFDAHTRGIATLRLNRSGPVVLHAGAGGASKRWPLDAWRTLLVELRARGLPARLIAGEVELEQFSAADRARFADLGGEYLADLPSLAAVLRPARAFIGADSGPAHLAAQLGLPTLALFGPTDPTLWHPAGPAAHVIAPDHPSPMTWLAPDRVLMELESLLARAHG